MVVIPVKDINGFTLYRRKRLGEKIPLYVAFPTRRGCPDDPSNLTAEFLRFDHSAPMRGEYRSIRDAERELNSGPAEFKVTIHLKVARVWIDDGFSRSILEEQLKEFIEEKMLPFAYDGEVETRIRIK